MSDRSVGAGEAFGLTCKVNGLFLITKAHTCKGNGDLLIVPCVEAAPEKEELRVK